MWVNKYKIPPLATFGFPLKPLTKYPLCYMWYIVNIYLLSMIYVFISI